MARAVVPGVSYHVTHRGNRRGDIFLRSEDRALYAKLLGENAEKFGLEIWAYCWMRNHVHLLVAPRSSDSLARAIGRAHGEYARRINWREGWTGHLWANRFFSCPLDGPHLWRAVRYVELNPVRAGLVARAEDYEWSSARANAVRESGWPQSPGTPRTPATSGGFGALLSPNRPFPGPVEDWRAWLAAGLSEEETAHLRLHTRTGRPLGSVDFVTLLEETLGRPLGPIRRGRKPRDVQGDEQK